MRYPNDNYCTPNASNNVISIPRSLYSKYPVILVDCIADNVAYTVGLCHNAFTWLPLQDGKKLITPKGSAIESYVKLWRHPPLKRPDIPCSSVVKRGRSV